MTLVGLFIKRGFSSFQPALTTAGAHRGDLDALPGPPPPSACQISNINITTTNNYYRLHLHQGLQQGRLGPVRAVLLYCTTTQRYTPYANVVDDY